MAVPSALRFTASIRMAGDSTSFQGARLTCHGGCARLDEQLGFLETKLRDADGNVQQLLGHSTALWLDDGARPSTHEQPSSDTGQSNDGHVDDADGPIQRRPR